MAIRAVLPFFLFLSLAGAATAQSCHYVANSGDSIQFAGDKAEFTYQRGGHEICDIHYGDFGQETQCGAKDPLNFAFIGRVPNRNAYDILIVETKAYYKICPKTRHPARNGWIKPQFFFE